jgi:hypothetical protein
VDRPKWKLAAFVAANGQDLRDAYVSLTHEQREAFRSEVKESRAEKRTMVRMNPKAVQKDFDKSFELLNQEVNTSKKMKCV